jgi:EmrB/QacA subfamily drug resistance transporter
MSAPTTQLAQPRPRTLRPGLLVVLLAAAQFMLIVDVTVVQVSLPTIGADLGLDRQALTWVVTAYTLAFGGLMVLGGRIADAVGARTVFLGGLALFVAASLASGSATDGGLLLAGRVGQGIGAAMMSPAALAVISTALTGPARDRALAVWAAIGGAGAAAGVLLGGLLTAGPGWRWVFFVNVPVGVAAFVAVSLLVPGARRPTVARRIDLLGAAVVTGATGSLIYGVVHAGSAGWDSRGTVAGLVAAAVGYAAFLPLETRVAVPLVHPATFLRRPVLAGVFVMLVATALMLGLFFLSSLYLQEGLGYGPLRTGLVFLPIAVAITAGAHLGGRLLATAGGRTVATAGFGLAAAGAAVLTQVSGTDHVWSLLVPAFTLAAFGIGAIFVTAFSATMSQVAAHEAGVASGVINTFHELGGAIGVAVVSTVASSSVAVGNAGPTNVGGFTDGYLVCAITAAVSALVALVLVPRGAAPSSGVGHGHGHGHGHG